MTKVFDIAFTLCNFLQYFSNSFFLLISKVAHYCMIKPLGNGVTYHPHDQLHEKSLTWILNEKRSEHMHYFSIKLNSSKKIIQINVYFCMI